MVLRGVEATSLGRMGELVMPKWWGVAMLLIGPDPYTRQSAACVSPRFAFVLSSSSVEDEKLRMRCMQDL